MGAEVCANPAEVVRKADMLIVEVQNSLSRVPERVFSALKLHESGSLAHMLTFLPVPAGIR